MTFFVVFLLLLLAGILFRLLILGAKLQWLVIVNATFVLFGVVVSGLLDRAIGNLSMPVILAVIVGSALAAWKGLELARSYVEHRFGYGGAHLAYRGVEFIVVGVGPAAVVFAFLYGKAQVWNIPNERLVVFGIPLLVAAAAYYLYDRRFQEKAALRNRDYDFEADLRRYYAQQHRSRA